VGWGGGVLSIFSPNPGMGQTWLPVREERWMDGWMEEGRDGRLEERMGKGGRAWFVKWG